MNQDKPETNYDTVKETDAFDDGYMAGWFKGKEQQQEFLRKKMKVLGYSEAEIQKILG